MGCMQYKQSDCLGQCTHSDIISTRHGAVIQAVAERGGFFRDQGYQLRNGVGFSATRGMSDQLFRKSKIERTAPVIIVGSGSGCHATVCGVSRAR